jgi:hypothetical protein
MSEEKASLELLGSGVLTLSAEVRDLRLHFDALERRFSMLEGRFAAMEARLGTIETRLGGIKNRVASKSACRLCSLWSSALPNGSMGKPRDETAPGERMPVTNLP